MTGRIIEEHRTSYVVSFDGAEYAGVVRGKFHAPDGESMFPKVGDLVECEKITEDQVVIESILPRRTEIARKAADSPARQVMVANADVMFVVMGLDGDFNLRRLERYLVLAEHSGVKAVVVLNKADLVPSPAEYLEQVRGIAPDVPAYAISAKGSDGLDIFAQHVPAGTIAVMLGSSGAGKSTIMNRLLLKEQQATGAVRGDDSRGRHTTTRRQMFRLPSGVFLIDTPGMRELGVLNEEDTEGEAFADIEALKQECRFTDCDHERSDGCAVQKAIADGALTEERLASYRKLQHEREYLESKASPESAHERRQKQRKLHTGYTQIQKLKDRNRPY